MSPKMTFRAGLVLNLMRLARVSPWHMLNLFVQAFIFYGADVLPGLVLERFIDTLGAPAARERDHFLWALLAGLFGAGCASVVGTLIWIFSEARVVASVQTLLRRNLFEHVLNTPSAAAASQSGERISRFRDDVAEFVRLLVFVPDLPMQLLMLTVVFGVLLNVNAKLALIATLPVGLCIIAAQITSRLVRRYRAMMQEALGRVTATLGEALNSVLAIKLAGTQEHIVRVMRAVGEQRRHSLWRTNLMVNLARLFAANVPSIALSVVLIAAVATGEVRRLTPGQIALFVTYLSALGLTVLWITDLLTRYRQGQVSLQRILDLMNGESMLAVSERNPIDPVGVAGQDIVPGSAAQPLKLLSVHNLRYQYPGSSEGLHDVSLELKPGTLTIITGRIGSGKSTLLRALLGLLPAQGEVFWNNMLVKQRDRFFRPPNAAYVPQAPRLFSDTLADNILLGLPADERLQRAVHQAVFESDVAQFDAGLDTLVGARGSKISGGQLQRAAAARAFVRDAALIVVDDLSSALDVDTEAELWRRLLRTNRQKCIVAVSHRRPALERADHVILMQNGRIRAQGSLSQLLATDAEMRALYDAAGGAPHSPD